MPAFDARAALMPLLALAGLCWLPAAWRRERPTAGLATAWLAWAALATLAAPDRNVALWGRYEVGTGLWFVAALVGLWCLGTSVRPAGAALVERALLGGCVVNAVVAVTQQVFDLRAFGLGLYQGRSAAFYGNPVYLAELLAGGLWLALCRSQRPFGAVTTVVIAAGVAASGSRSGLALAAVAVVATLPRLGWRRAGAGALLVAAGIAAGSLVVDHGGGGGTTGASAVARAGEAPVSGTRPRLETWRAGVEAAVERPALGWGPSGFLAATSTRRTLALVHAEGPDRLFADAHDLVVEVAVDTGLVGLVLFAGWVIVGVRRARRAPRRASPLLGFACLSLGVMLAEPFHVGTVPLSMLALGAAAACAHGEEAAVERRGQRTVTQRIVTGAAALAIAAGAAMSFVVGSGLVLLREANVAGHPAAAARATRWLPPWSGPATTVAFLYGYQGLAGRDVVAARAALHWRQLAAARDRLDPQPSLALGEGLLGAGDIAGASAAFGHALTRDPWSVCAMRGLAVVARLDGRPDRVADLLARATRAVGTPQRAGSCLLLPPP